MIDRSSLSTQDTASLLACNYTSCLDKVFRDVVAVLSLIRGKLTYFLNSMTSDSLGV